MDAINFGTMTSGFQGGVVGFAMPTQVVVFYARPELVPFESEKTGAPVYRSADYVRIATPGERDEIDREATQLDKVHYRREWEAYKENRENIPTGTGLAMLFPGNPEIVEGLKGSKFHTVEQLAAASDATLQNMPMGGLDWRLKARRFLEMIKDAGRFGEIEQKQKDLDYRLKTQAEENALLRSKIEALEAEKAKSGRSRAA